MLWALTQNAHGEKMVSHRSFCVKQAGDFCLMVHLMNFEPEPFTFNESQHIVASFIMEGKNLRRITRECGGETIELILKYSLIEHVPGITIEAKFPFEVLAINVPAPAAPLSQAELEARVKRVRAGIAEKARTMTVAQWVFKQTEENRCTVTPRFLNDSQQVWSAYQELRDWAFSEAQKCVAIFWLETTTGWVRRSDKTAELSQLQKRIIEIVNHLKSDPNYDYENPPDELVAAQLGRNTRGQPYTRETVNRQRSKLRKMGMKV